MNLFKSIWTGILTNGASSGISKYHQKKIAFINTLWFTALAGYIIFFIFLLLLKPQHVNELWLSNGIMVGGFAVAWFLMKHKKFLGVRLLLLASVYGGIFFYDNFLGINAGVYFYYFTFAVALATLFSWRDGKAWLVVIFILPLILFYFSHFYEYKISSYVHIADKWVSTLYFFNFSLAFILVAGYGSYIVHLNTDAEKQLEQSGLNLQTLLDNTSAHIWSVNKQYELISFNKVFQDAVKRYYKKDVEEGFNVKEQLFTLANYPESLKVIYQKALAGEVYSGEFWSNDVPFDIMAAPLYDVAGNIAGATFYDRNIAETKQRDTEFIQMNLNLQTLIDNIEGGIWSIDSNYKVIAVNQSFKNSMKRFFDVNIEVGYIMEEMHNRADFPQKFKEHHLRVLTGQSLLEEYEFHDNYYELQGEPLRNAAGENIGATFHNRNITQRKKSRQAVEELSLNLQSLIDNTENSIWSLDTEYKIITASKVYRQDMKNIFDADIVPGFDVRQLFSHPAYPPDWKQQYKDVFSGKELFVNFIFNNQYYELFARPIRNSNSRVVGAAFYVNNITDRQQNALKLQQSEINLQTLIDNTYGSIWGIDSGYSILACNEKYKNDINVIFNKEVAPGFNMKELFDLPNYPQKWKMQYERVLNGESLFETYEMDGSIFELTAVPIKNTSGAIMGAALHAADVTEAKKNELDLITSKEKAEEASRAKARFLSNMSHELRTPLNGVIGITNILLSEQYLESQKEQLDLLKYSSDHMMSLVNDILDYNKIEAGKIELEKSPFNLAAMLDKTSILFHTQAKEKSLQFELKADEELNREVLGDITRLRQVLNNLLGNAIKFTEKGKVKLTASVAKQLSDKQCLIRFSVSDTGIGIDSSKMNKIFDSFTQADANTTRKYGGTGLGLTISRRLLELMHSKLEVESKPGTGSNFSFEMLFECNTQESTAQVNHELYEMASFADMHVLVAEDNMINMMVVQRILEKWNMHVYKAENGEVALQKMTEQKFDLVLMDMEMPVMDGLTAVAAIRKTNAQIPIIALTAASFDNMHEFLIEKGLNDYVQKPFRPEELHQKIKRLVKLS